MNEREYLQRVIRAKFPESADWQVEFFEQLLSNEELLERAEYIIQEQTHIIAKVKTQFLLQQIRDEHLPLRNARQGQPYFFEFELSDFPLDQIQLIDIEGLDELGLSFVPEQAVIKGTPTAAGNHELRAVFELRDSGDRDAKSLRLIVNPDPKSLWKEIEPDASLPFHKPHTASEVATLGTKTLVAASKRGRSHANNGTFRDDDYAFAELNDGWCCALVADGAGSARYSRKGSRLTGEFFLKNLRENLHTTEAITTEQALDPESHDEELDHFLKQTLGKSARQTHDQLTRFADQNDHTLKDYHTTLAVAIFKKFDAHYFIGTFSVGDCPIVALTKDLQPTVLNHLDVGEYGGGTRFLTMSSIFLPENYPERFQMHVVPEAGLHYLFLMTDGIYDPKFEVENRLIQTDAWASFVADLRGENEDGAAVALEPGNEAAGEQLLNWMDFWSKGNHDDRTLLVVF